MDPFELRIAEALRRADTIFIQHNPTKKFSQRYLTDFLQSWAAVDRSKRGDLTVPELEQVAHALNERGWRDWGPNMSIKERHAWRAEATANGGRVSVERFLLISEDPRECSRLAALSHNRPDSEEGMRRVVRALDAAEGYFRRFTAHTHFSDKYRPDFCATWRLFDPGCERGVVLATDMPAFAQQMQRCGWLDWKPSDREKLLWRALGDRQNGLITIEQVAEISENIQYQLPAEQQQPPATVLAPNAAPAARNNDDDGAPPFPMATPALSSSPIRAGEEPRVQTDEEANEKLACVVCLVKPKSMLFLPCRHISVCSDCSKSSAFTKEPGSDEVPQCPVCREPIQSSFSVFL